MLGSPTQQLWAKSPERGQSSGETLSQHTANVLTALAQLHALRPDLGAALDMPRFWHRLFWACVLHDFGKAATGFQRQVRDPSFKWGQRHEVLSLAFVPWLFEANHEDYLWIVAAVASHHKERATIDTLYPNIEEADYDALTEMVAEIPDTALEELWTVLHDQAPMWRDTLGFAAAGVTLVPSAPLLQCKTAFRNSARDTIRLALRRYRAFAAELERTDARTALVVLALATRGSIVAADHLGSAHVLQVSGVPPFDAQRALAKLHRAWSDLHEHQIQAAGAAGSAILRAPTGSGKTEAALLWATAQGNVQPVPRLFYVLPFQASMNAMYDRLVPVYGEGAVGLQHGHSVQALYRRLLDQEWSPRVAERKARYAQNLARLLHPPVRVLSPYQLLKACYRVRGYEAILTDLFGAVFVLDEIHAYEPERLALIVKMIEYLRRHFQAQFFVMSATLPSLLQRRLSVAIGASNEFVAAPALFKAFQRHVVHVLPGELLDRSALQRIANNARSGKAVLVCCNTVKRAQAACEQLRVLLPEDAYIDLLHGSFNGRDRLSKERRLMERVHAGSQQQSPTVLVATQVVEVSLDVDFDLLYSDPAPLDALLQRFGRVNRRNRKGLCPVYVFAQPDDGQHVYVPDLVQAALACLATSAGSGRVIDEENVHTWLDGIYTGAIERDWCEHYDRAAAEFDAACLASLRPFEASKELEDLFYSAFDAVEVLPAALEDEYRQLMDLQPIEASSLLVGIRAGMYMALKDRGKVRFDGDLPPILDVEYDAALGLRRGETNE